MAEVVSSLHGDLQFYDDPYYKYESLPKDHFRLLEIKGNLNSDVLEEPIEISLAAYPLTNCPSYVALSYTWGNPAPEEDPTMAIFT